MLEKKYLISQKVKNVTSNLQPHRRICSKEGFALYIGKTPRAVAEMAKAGKLPAFYMTDPLKPGGHAELWINRREWDKYAAQLVDEAPTEWHDWKNRISYSKSRHGRAA